MPKVIVSTTPIISLLKIGKLEILKDLYGTIIIPNAVFREMEAGKRKLHYEDLKNFEWISIQKVTTSDIKHQLKKLDDGEAEVLILAKELNADLVILDEAKGREYARKLNLNLTGTIGVLLKAKDKGIISSISELLEIMNEKGTWLSGRLIDSIRKIANE